MLVPSYAGLMLSILALIGILYTTISNEWQVGSAEDTQPNMRQIRAYLGLWMRCVSPRHGIYNCDKYDVSTLGLEGFVKVTKKSVLNHKVLYTFHKKRHLFNFVKSVD